MPSQTSTLLYLSWIWKNILNSAQSNSMVPIKSSHLGGIIFPCVVLFFPVPNKPSLHTFFPEQDLSPCSQMTRKSMYEWTPASDSQNIIFTPECLELEFREGKEQRRVIEVWLWKKQGYESWENTTEPHRKPSRRKKSGHINPSYRFQEPWDFLYVLHSISR